ncbi:MAG TPA: SMI1/KNR4 family protein [Allosphingosinicella sp.]|nr:SMI1/KNR4 family protein [Allosphingosinicella sp.]
MFEGREWHRVECASAAAIAQLKAIAPASLPESYFALLSFSNGGEGPLPVQPLWLCLYPAEEVIEIEQAGTFREFFPGLFVIGGNGGGEAVAFDLRESEPYPIVAFDETNIDLPESVRQIAESFDGALKLIGRSER